MTKKTYIGVDVGGTKIKVGLVDSSWKTLNTAIFLTEAKKGLTTVLKNIDKAIDSVWKDDVVAIGVGFAGLTDPRKGVLIRGTNFPKDVTNVNLCEILANKYQRPVIIDNDVHCFTVAEATVGVAKGKRIVFGLAIGTGIGGGLVVDGKVFRGAQNAAGEIGHFTLDINSQLVCGCGKHGHFESMSAGRSMIRNCASCTEGMFFPDVMKLAESGNPEAQKAVSIFRRGMKAGLTDIIYAYNPDAIVLGGGAVGNSRLWRPAAEEALKDLIFDPLKKTEIIESVLGDDSNVIGAAILASQS